MTQKSDRISRFPPFLTQKRSYFLHKYALHPIDKSGVEFDNGSGMREATGAFGFIQR
jgi:hypothetical protein